MFKTNKNNITAIVRSVGERTEIACYDLLCHQVPEENIVIVNESPFSAAIKKTFEIGLDRDLEWTLCIDADVLIHKNAVRDLLKVAHQADDNVFEIQGFVLCKFFGGVRPAGNHLYRTKLLKKGLECIADASFIRPETETIERMQKLGYPFIEVQIPIGLHDYEQFYKDVYRKCFVQAHKHSYLSEKLFRPLWSRLAKDDPDFQVALWGLEDGLRFDGKVQIDVTQYFGEVSKYLEEQQWKEKDFLRKDFYEPSEVNRAIKNFIFSDEFMQSFPYRVNAFKEYNSSLSQKIIKKLSKKVREYSKRILKLYQ